jgi:hypothetical protein
MRFWQIVDMRFGHEIGPRAKYVIPSPCPLPEGEELRLPLPLGEGRVRVSLGMSELQ